MKKTITTAALAAALFTAGCATAPVSPETNITPGVPVALSSSDVALVEAGVRDVLKDPGSAVFGGIAAAQGPDVTAVCGYVNAKNSYGAFTGFSPFNGLLLPGRYVVAVIGSTDNEAQAVRIVCGQYGVRF